MKVVHLGKFYFPDLGGIESVTKSLAERSAEAGADVRVVCFHGSPRVEGRDTINNVKITRAKWYVNISSQPFGFDYIRKSFVLIRDADIVHMHAPNLIASVPAMLLSRRVKLVVHWHSDIRNKGLLGWLIRPLERKLLQRADVIIVTSPIYGKASPSLTRFQTKLEIVPIGVCDSLEIKPSIGLPEECEEQWGKLLSGKKLILAVGRLVPFKGFDILIDAAKHLSDDALVFIVGDGPERRNLQELIDAHGLNRKVFLIGSLPGRGTGGKLHWLFRHSYLYCLPSVDRSESFGVVLVEAMSYGIPVVSSAIEGSGVSWVNQHGESGLNFPPRDVIALANACNCLLSSSALHDRLSNGARKRFLSEFSEELSVARILEIYENLLETPTT